MNAVNNFLRVEENSLNSVTIASCYVTGLNRDHAYTPGFSWTLRFLLTGSNQLDHLELNFRKQLGSPNQGNKPRVPRGLCSRSAVTDSVFL